MSSHDIVVREILTEASSFSHTILNLNYKGLTEVPPALLTAEFDRIQQLFLKRNNLTTLPSSIGCLENLTVLYLPSNSITSLPAEVGQLKCLETLDVSQNRLVDIPSSITDLSHLQRLYLSNNEITEISSDICKLQKLKVLILTNNRLQWIPPEICKCTHLHTLHADKNLLRCLPHELIKLENLKELSVMRNLLTYIPVLLGPRTKLDYINITNNPYLVSVLGNSCQFGAVHSVYTNISGCGVLSPLEVGLRADQLITIDGLQGVIPEELTTVWDVNQEFHHAYSLFELALRACYKWQDKVDWNLLPDSLVSRLSTPVAICAHGKCGVPLFTSAYVIIERLQEPVNKVTLFHSKHCVPAMILRLLRRLDRNRLV